MVDVVQHWFVLPLVGVSQLSLHDGTLGAIESVQKLLCHLHLAINEFWLHVGIPVKSYTFKHSGKLFYHYIVVHANIVTCLDEICHMLFWVALPIKIAGILEVDSRGHVECIDPLGVRLGVQVSLTRISTQLYLDCVCNQVLDLLDGHKVWRPTILEFTALL